VTAHPPPAAPVRLAVLALARKYRPKNFAAVAVQTHVSNTLKGAIARGRVAHGYLLCGPRGTGKTTLARVLAMALNCERLAAERRRSAELAQASGAGAGGARAGNDVVAANAASSGEPCGECDSCRRIWAGSASLDVVEIDAASNRGVDDARELRERAMYAPSGDDRYKVYIVDEAHMLTREAWNALLKILEEPPPRVVFVFATTEPQKIAQTAAPVLSRVQRFDLKRIGAPDIRDRLAIVLKEEGVPFEPDALGAIARAADGGLRDALSLTDQVLSMGDGTVTLERVREALGLVAEDEYLAVLDLVAEHRAADVFATIGRLAELGVDFTQFLSGFADALRAQLAVELGGAAADISERLRVALEERRGRLGAGDVLRMLNLVAELEPRFRRSGHQQLLLETLLVRCALLDRSVSLEDVLRNLAGGDGGAPRAGGSSAPDAGAAPTAPRGAAVRPSGGPPPVAARAATLDPPRTWAPPAQPRAAAAPVPVAPAAPPDDEGWRASLVEAPPPDVAAVLDTLGVDAPRRPAPPRRAPVTPAPVASESAPAALAALAALAAPASGASGTVPDLNRVVEQWDAVAERLRADNHSLVASLIEHAEPLAVAGSGVLTVKVEDTAAEQALDNRKDAVVAALQAVFGPGITRLAIKAVAAPTQPLGERRVTAESVKADKLTKLRKRDPALAQAIEELDLELLD